MKISHRTVLAIVIALAAASSAAAQVAGPPPDLAAYVTKKDDTFAWKLKGKTETDAGTVYDLDLVSQTWHDIKWEHGLQVYVPKGAKPQSTMVLWNQGGKPSGPNAALGIALSQKVNAPLAFLYGVPSQPQLGGKKEDALIAETFVRFLETKDSTWPLLFPMVKSVVAAMDTLQAFAKEEWKFEVKQFVVTGASKRGWTSWLTAASGDPRVKAISPLVIDTLKFPEQMENQVKAFGKPSEMIRDYTERNLVPIPKSGDANKLWSMVDPWVYREKLTLPKMIINGTNDPYWPQDALNSYWDDLKGEKHIMYVPNAGHGLREETNGKAELMPMRAVNTLAAFGRSQIYNKPLPNIEWKHEDSGNGPRVWATSDSPFKKVRVWSADAATRDFRKSVWKEQPTETENKNQVGQMKLPETGFRAYFIEFEFESDGQPFTLSTQLRVVEAKK